MSFAGRLKNSIGFRLDNWITYLYFTAKPRWLNPFHGLRCLNEMRARRDLRENKDLWEILTAVISASTSTGCEYSDYLELYRQVGLRKPRYILELGSGISTCVIAYAARELCREKGMKPVFVSVEEDAGWHEQVKSAFPHELREFVSFHLSPRIERAYGEMTGCCYRELPDHPYEFVFVDGPTGRAGGEQAPKHFNSDLLNLKKAPKFAIIDQRVLTYRVLKRMLPHANVNYHPVKKITTLEWKGALR